MYFYDEGILIAIDQDVLDRQSVAGRAALEPQLAPASRMEMCQPGLAGLFESLCIHVRNHEDLMRPRVLNHRGQQAVAVEFRQEVAAMFSTFGFG